MQGIGWDGANEISYLPAESIKDAGERQEIFMYDFSGSPLCGVVLVQAISISIAPTY